MGLAEGVTTGNQGNGLLVVHGHAAEGDTDITGSSNGVGDTVRTLGVNIDQTHDDSSQWVLQIASLDIALLGLVLLALGQVTNIVAEPLGLAAPVDRLIGLPGIRTTPSKAEGLETHGLKSNITGQEEQISPGDLVTVLLLNGPQQAAGLVKTDIVGPAVEGSKSLLTLATTTTAVEDTVSTRAVPRHTDKQTTVVAEISRPEVLGVGHQVIQILLEGIVVKALEGRGIVEVLAHGVGSLGVLAQNVQLEAIGPPVTVAGTTTGHIGRGVMNGTSTHDCGE